MVKSPQTKDSSIDLVTGITLMTHQREKGCRESSTVCEDGSIRPLLA